MSPADPSRPVRLALHGAGGRMGAAVARALADTPEIRLVAAWVRPDDPRTGRDLGVLHGLAPLGIPLAPAGTFRERPDVVVDFSVPAALAALLGYCRAERFPLVSGTTGEGLSDETFAPLAAVAPVLWAPNFSPALAALTAVLPALRRLLPDADVAVLDVHHRAKRDAPSGTARRLATLAGGEGGAAPTASLRTGRVVGEHALYFEGADERLEIWHRVRDRAVFARGALLAARWLAARPPGRYAFAEALGAEGDRNPLL